MWQLGYYSLVVRQIIFQRFFLEDSYCLLCALKEESINHLFFQCRIIQEVWKFSFNIGWLSIMLQARAILECKQ